MNTFRLTDLSLLRWIVFPARVSTVVSRNCIICGFVCSFSDMSLTRSGASSRQPSPVHATASTLDERHRDGERFFDAPVAGTEDVSAAGSVPPASTRPAAAVNPAEAAVNPALAPVNPAKADVNPAQANVNQLQRAVQRPEDSALCIKANC